MIAYALTSVHSIGHGTAPADLIVHSSPEPRPDDADEAALRSALDSLDATIRQFIWRPNDWEYHVLALWIMHTHLIDAFDWSPILGIASPDGGYGKTTTLLLLTGLTRNGMYREKITEPSAKRLLDRANKGGVPLTACFDQLRGGNTSWEDLFDIGTRRGGKITTSVKPMDGKDWEPEDYLVFGPKAVGYISTDNALRGTNISRAIILNYVEKGGERVARTYPYNADDSRKAPEQVRQLREQLERLASPTVLASVRSYDTGLPRGRRNDTFRPLVAIGDLAGDPWKGRARALMTTIDRGDRKPSRNLQALRDVVQACDGMDDSEIIPSGIAATKLCEIEEGRWADERLTAHRLTKIMESWGIPSEKAGSKRGYSVRALRRALGGQSETSVTDSRDS